MTIRDLGYRPYDGARLPPSHNTWVLMRYALWRAWSSWLVKLAVLTCTVPVLGYSVGYFFARQLVPQIPAGADGGFILDLAVPARAVSHLLWAETWFFVSLVTVGAGASAIAEDQVHRAFPFFFAKPVTPFHYLTGRVLAVATWIFVVAFLPALLFVMVLVAFGPREEAFENGGLVLPALVFSLVLAAVMASASVAVSSLGKSRALTVTAWLAVFIVPHALASVVDNVAQNSSPEGWPWLYLGSFTALLATVREALFNVESSSPLEWWHASAVLALLVVGSLALAAERVRRAEVVS